MSYEYVSDSQRLRIYEYLRCSLTLKVYIINLFEIKIVQFSLQNSLEKKEDCTAQFNKY
jgi:hypothetical protein